MYQSFISKHPSIFNWRLDMPDCSFDHDSLDALEPDQRPLGGTYSYCDRGEHVVCGYGIRITQDMFDRAFPNGKKDSVVNKVGKTVKLLKGGKRAGSGRKSLDLDGTVVTTVRLTGQQKATFEMIGGVSWLRSQLDLFSA